MVMMSLFLYNDLIIDQKLVIKNKKKEEIGSSKTLM